MQPFSPKFIESARHLARLHELIRIGKGDADDADELRDLMDDSWGQLTDQESHWFRELSADLNTIGRSLPQEESPTLDEETRGILKKAEKSGDWEGLKAELAKNPGVLPPHAAAFVRGRRWERLDDRNSSLVFLEEAARLAPNVSLYKISIGICDTYLIIIKSIMRQFDEEMRVLDETKRRKWAEAYDSGVPAA